MKLNDFLRGKLAIEFPFLSEYRFFYIADELTIKKGLPPKVTEKRDWWSSPCINEGYDLDYVDNIDKKYSVHILGYCYDRTRNRDDISITIYKKK